jgi:hypothetical protein
MKKYYIFFNSENFSTMVNPLRGVGGLVLYCNDAQNYLIEINLFRYLFKMGSSHPPTSIV